MLSEREAEGIAKYGCSLESHNGRDVHKDLEEELIDGWQYAVQARMEREDLRSLARRLAEALAHTKHAPHALKRQNWCCTMCDSALAEARKAGLLEEASHA
jgi:hypothetical protein